MPSQWTTSHSLCTSGISISVSIISFLNPAFEKHFFMVSDVTSLLQAFDTLEIQSRRLIVVFYSRFEITLLKIRFR